LSKINALEIAAKQRHLHLLEKIRNGKRLSKSELKELEEFETLSKKTKKKTAKKKTQTKTDKNLGRIFTTQKKAAEYLGVSVRTIRNYVKRGMPLVDGKKYSSVFLDQMKVNDGSLADEIKDRKNEAEAENKTLKNKLLTIDLEIRQGKLIPIDEVEAGRVARIQEIKTVLMGLPRKLPALMKDKNTREQTAIIKREIEHCINVFANE